MDNRETELRLEQECAEKMENLLYTANRSLEAEREKVRVLQEALECIQECADHGEEATADPGYSCIIETAKTALDALEDRGYSLECPCCPANYRSNDREQIASIADHGKCSACHREWQTTATDPETTNPNGE